MARHTTKENEMGKLVVTEFVSLDGVFEDPGGASAHLRARRVVVV
jgi:hypothetical protein